jgi:2-polyprenyl-6-methoxyphenol hydroxylase-like FAD-dependent oxidoreductase
MYRQRNGLIIGQNVTEAILRSHIEKYSCHVELSTRLQSFEQQSDHVIAQLVKTTDDGQEVPETLSVQFLLGADGARGTVDILTIRFDAELFVIRSCTKDARLDFRGADS